MSIINDSDFRTKIAGETILAYQFVKQTNDTVIEPCDAITDIPYGVAQHAADANDDVLVVVSGETKILANTDLAVGNVISTLETGYCGIATTTTYPRGRVVRAVVGIGTTGTPPMVGTIQLMDVGIPLA